MKLKSVKLKNFRGYYGEVEIEFDDLTAFVGKNDIGKSTILEALDIFFNEGKGPIKIDEGDVNKEARDGNDKDIYISVCFEELPESIIIDATNETKLCDEYLLNSKGQLEIVKKYPNGGKEKVFVKAHHPCGEKCKDLLSKINRDLQKIIKDNEIECDDRKTNAIMRQAIWDHFQARHELEETEIDVTKGETKSIWGGLQRYLPLYSLFQSDRKNSDGDSEVQDPLKEAVRQIISDEDLKAKFEEIASQVQSHLNDVAERTLKKLDEMNPELAKSLNPVIPSAESLKWADVFKNVSITGDDDIPINKRGSGVKRLILLNFFRAEAERRKAEKNIPSIIYAIEEPETSQHFEHQRKLIRAFLDLSGTVNTQVVLTTHSAVIVKGLAFENLRLVKGDDTTKRIEKVLPNTLAYPSLNEVNYIAFSETTEEYHNELYGYIESKGRRGGLEDPQTKRAYIEVRNGSEERKINIALSRYIRTPNSSSRE